MTSSPLYSTNEIRNKIGHYPILNESLPIELHAKILRYKGLSYREISQILNISYSYAHKLVNRSHPNLIKLLNQLRMEVLKILSYKSKKYMSSIEDIKEKLSHHLDPKTDPCEDRGVFWPCDVAGALLTKKEIRVIEDKDFNQLEDLGLFEE